jgi:hypothetical protein
MTVASYSVWVKFVPLDCDWLTPEGKCLGLAIRYSHRPEAAMSTPWQGPSSSALAPGADAAVQLSAALINRVVARQASPLVAVSGIASGAGTANPQSTSDDPLALSAVTLLDQNINIAFSATRKGYGSLATARDAAGILEVNPFGDEYTDLLQEPKAHLAYHGLCRKPNRSSRIRTSAWWLATLVICSSDSQCGLESGGRRGWRHRQRAFR